MKNKINIICNALTCDYNYNNRCKKICVNIAGNNASINRNTFCASFANKYTVKVKPSTPAVIACDVNNCDYYNNNGFCILNNIHVQTYNNIIYLKRQTFCSNFKLRGEKDV